MAPKDQMRYEGFAERMKQLRQRTGKTQPEFANYVQVSPKSIYRYEAGEQLPAGHEVVKLAQAFPGEIEWILTGRRPTELEQRTVGNLSAKVREVIAHPENLSTDDHEVLAWLARILEERQHNPKLVHALVDHVAGVDAAFNEGRWRRDSPPSASSQPDAEMGHQSNE